MKLFALLTITLLMAGGCSDQNQNASPKKPPPPPPPPAGLSEAQARALGVGSCDDLTKIKVLPFYDEIGQDVQFDRMVVNFDGYSECLIGKIADQTEIEDRSQGPKRRGYTVGNLAYDVIGSSGKLDYMTCLPSEISESWDRIGAQALTDWLNQDGNPELLQACVRKNLGGT